MLSVIHWAAPSPEQVWLERTQELSLEDRVLLGALHRLQRHRESFKAPPNDYWPNTPSPLVSRLHRPMSADAEPRQDPTGSREYRGIGRHGAANTRVSSGRGFSGCIPCLGSPHACPVPSHMEEKYSSLLLCQKPTYRRMFGTSASTMAVKYGRLAAPFTVSSVSDASRVGHDPNTASCL